MSEYHHLDSLHPKKQRKKTPQVLKVHSKNTIKLFRTIILLGSFFFLQRMALTCPPVVKNVRVCFRLYCYKVKTTPLVRGASFFYVVYRTCRSCTRLKSWKCLCWNTGRHTSMKLPYVRARTLPRSHTHSFLSGACRSVEMSNWVKRQISSNASIFWLQKALPVYNLQRSYILTRVKNSWACHFFLICSLLFCQVPVFVLEAVRRAWCSGKDISSTEPGNIQKTSCWS